MLKYWSFFPLTKKNLIGVLHCWKDRIFPKPHDTQWVETVWKRLIQFINRNFFPMSSGASEWASARAKQGLFLCRSPRCWPLQKQTCCMSICFLFICQNLTILFPACLSKNETTILWYHGFALHWSLESEVTSKQVWHNLFLSLLLSFFVLSFFVSWWSCLRYSRKDDSE